MTDAARRIALCRVEELAPGEMRKVEVPDMPPLAVFNVDGAFYATHDTCTHAQASLTDGDLEGDRIVCPAHFGEFHVPTGRALCFPLTTDLRTFPTEIADGTVYALA